eukprot:TRINITY_DN4018_c0_g1_i1.p1 TRINITY_DN4018_c0_g1~~TRINITY_DN4018_c0_g1_i1.p1  ORF type:complete len:601 (+),score=100.24 TRINITY_DN4018_c0_g1_i1:197-1804(+)
MNGPPPFHGGHRMVGMPMRGPPSPQICKFFDVRTQGGCAKGHHCDFFHMRPQMGRPPVRPCRYFNVRTQSGCREGRGCPYLHPPPPHFQQRFRGGMAPPMMPMRPVFWACPCGFRKNFNRDNSCIKCGVARNDSSWLLEPQGGVPNLIRDEAGLQLAVAALSEDTGPVALSIQDAVGYVYGADACLLVVRRQNCGPYLIDTRASLDLTELINAISHEEFIVHNYPSQITALFALGLHPRSVFDTHAAASLLGVPWNSLDLHSVTYSILGIRLAEDSHFSRSDWSRRPISFSMRRYASLCSEKLIPLKVELESRLAAGEKSAWASELFSNYVQLLPKPDTWREMLKHDAVTDGYQLARIRSLWQIRDEVARSLSVPPTEILKNSAILQAAKLFPAPASVEDFVQLSEVKRTSRALATVTPLPAYPQPVAFSVALFDALTQSVDEHDLPTVNEEGEAPPLALWDQAALDRRDVLKEMIKHHAHTNNMTEEILLKGNQLDLISWSPPPEGTGKQFLRSLGVCEWQVLILAEAVPEYFA